jgi:hypothetical protein
MCGVTTMTNHHLQFDLRHKAHSNQLTVKLLIVLANKTIKPSTINLAQAIKLLHQ